MIRTKLHTGQGEFLEGGEELIETWQHDNYSHIWVDIEQEPSAAEVALLDKFGCHELVIADSHRQRHPPKIEKFPDHLFVLFRGISQIDEQLDIKHLQLGLFIGERFLITRHTTSSYSVKHWQNHANLFEELKNPLLLAIHIMHYSAGKYLEQLLDFESNLSDLEDTMQTSPNDESLKELLLYKTRLRKLRRIFDYHQRMFAQYMLDEMSESPDSHELKHQLQDLYERCERLHSLCTMYYEISGDLIEGYLSLSSHQLNQTMRVLTVITAIFVPLSFIAGLYGMNFEYMPELRYHNAYFIALGVMAITATGLLTLFRAKKWL